MNTFRQENIFGFIELSQFQDYIFHKYKHYFSETQQKNYRDSQFIFAPIIPLSKIVEEKFDPTKFDSKEFEFQESESEIEIPKPNKRPTINDILNSSNQYRSESGKTMKLSQLLFTCSSQNSSKNTTQEESEIEIQYASSQENELATSSDNNVQKAFQFQEQDINEIIEVEELNNDDDDMENFTLVADLDDIINYLEPETEMEKKESNTEMKKKESEIEMEKKESDTGMEKKEPETEMEIDYEIQDKLVRLCKKYFFGGQYELNLSSDLRTIRTNYFEIYGNLSLVKIKKTISTRNGIMELFAYLTKIRNDILSLMKKQY